MIENDCEPMDPKRKGDIAVLKGDQQSPIGEDGQEA